MGGVRKLLVEVAGKIGPYTSGQKMIAIPANKLNAGEIH